MKCSIVNDLGEIAIDTDIIAEYAGSIVVESFGIVGMAGVSMKDGIVHLLKRDSARHGINVRVVDNKLELDFHVIVVYGANINAISDNLIETVKYKVEKYTGVEVSRVNIYVQGVRVID